MYVPYYKGTITVVGQSGDAAVDKINKQVIATNSMIEISKRQVVNVKDIDVVINMITTIAVKKH